MAILGIKVPDEIAKYLDRIEAPGEKVPRSDKHITLLYLGDDVSLEEIGHIVATTGRLTEEFPPFDVEISEVSTFPEGDQGFPVICPVVSDELQRLHDELAVSCDEDGIEYSKKFPTYKPHVSLSFSPTPFEGHEFRALTWTCADIVLWAGEESDHRIATTFELMG